MDDRVVPFSAPGHSAVEPLLPWLVNGTLDGEELADVSRHVAVCRVCQREIQSLRKVQAMCVAADTSTDADRALARLAPRLSDRRPAGRAGGSWHRWRTASAVGLAATVAVAVGLGMTVAVRAPDTPSPAYRTLGAEIHAPAAAGSIVVRFSSVPTPGELATVVHATGAHSVSGPNGMGAFVLDVDGARQGAALAYLRGRPDVTLAEGLGAAVQPR